MHCLVRKETIIWDKRKDQKKKGKYCPSIISHGVPGAVAYLETREEWLQKWLETF